MPYLTEEQIDSLKFSHIGKNVKISSLASIYDAEKIKIGDNSRIDDFCILSGKLNIGKHNHITPMCLFSGGEKGIDTSDFCTFAYGVKVFTQSDDYSGSTLTNSTVPIEYKNEYKRKISIYRHSIVGAGSIIMPGVTLEEGTSIGAMSLVIKSTTPWGIYAGSPAKRIRERIKNLLQLEKEYIEAYKDDSF